MTLLDTSVAQTENKEHLTDDFTWHLSGSDRGTGSSSPCKLWECESHIINIHLQPKNYIIQKGNSPKNEE